MAAVLVCEDDADLRKSLAAVLAAKGHTVAEASSSGAVLGALATENVDVVLLDLHLEDVSGLVLLEKIKALEPELPVVILTGEIGIPIAVMTSFPSKALLGLLSPAWAAYAVALTAAFLFLSALFWRGSVARYTSSSS